MVKVGWSITHQEFTISDYYYFSILQKEALRQNIIIDEVSDWKSLENYHTIVFNYPEIAFSKNEVKDVERWVYELGKKVILLGYYKNEDKIADTCNTLARAFGMELNSDEVIDETSNHNGEPYFIVTSKIRRYNKDEKNRVTVNSIMLPCCASIKPLMPDIKIVARAEDSAKSNQDNYTLLIAEHIASQSGGYFCLAGTCVFWDNYSISLYDNLPFSLQMLIHHPPLKESKTVRLDL